MKLTWSISNADVDARYLVNFRYGRRGTSLRDGTKTSSPVTRSNAEKLFDSVVVSKINDGYRRVDGDAPPLTVIDTGVDANGRDTELLKKLAICARGAWPEKERDRLFWRSA